MQHRPRGVTARAQLGGWFREALAVTIRARDLADVLLVADRCAHVAPHRRHVLRAMRSIAEAACDKPGAACERDRERDEREALRHRAPSG
jgi:hypothetical protein